MLGYPEAATYPLEWTRIYSLPKIDLVHSMVHILTPDYNIHSFSLSPDLLEEVLNRQNRIEHSSAVQRDLQKQKFSDELVKLNVPPRSRTFHTFGYKALEDMVVYALSLDIPEGTRAHVLDKVCLMEPTIVSVASPTQAA